MIPASRPPTSSSPLAAKLLAAMTALALSSSPSAFAVEQTWDGAASGIWDTSALNWGGAAFTSSNDALFTGTPTNNVTSATGLTIGAITLDNTFTGTVALTGANTVTGATTINGGTLSVLNAGTAINTVTTTNLGTSAITVGSGGTFSVDDSGNGTTGNERILAIGNTISGSGTINAKASELMTNGWSSINFTGDLSGFTGTLNVVTPSTANRSKVKFTASQATLLSSSATVNVQNGAQLYLNQALNYGFAIKLNGGTGGEGNGSLRLDNASLNVTGAVTLQADSTISGAGTISGAIGQSGGTYRLTKVGNNTTVLTGANSYTGGTTISAGTLQVGNGSTTGTLGSGSVTNNATLTFNRSDDIIVANNITNSNAGAGILNKLGAGKLTLSGTNTIGGSANITVGSVDITGSTTTDGGSVTNTGYFNASGNTAVTVQSGGSLAINGTTGAITPNSIIGQNVTGTTTLAVNGGALTVGGNTGFVLGNNRADTTGVLTISSGTATINAGSATATDIRSFVAIGRDLASGTINLNGGTLASARNFVRDGGSATANGGTANFNFGGGTLKALANQSDWLNSTTINTYQQALSSVTTSSAASTIDSNGFTVGINNAITGAGGFHIISSSGNGTVNFGGSSYAYTGATSVDSGTLNTNAASVTLSGAATIAGGTLALNGASAGTLALGANTFTMSLGTLSYSLGDQITGTGSFGISGGTLDLTSSISDYSLTYTVLNGFTSGSVSGLTIANYDTTNWIASLGTDGVLSFASAIPEPSAYAALAGLGALGLVVYRRRRAA